MLSEAFFIGGLNTRVGFTFVSADQANNQTTITINDVDFGTPHPRRRVFVGVTVATNSGVEPTTMTIGGVTATKHVGLAPAGIFSVTVQIWSALVPTGATGTVVFGGLSAGDMDAGKIYVWAGYDLASATARDTAAVAASASPSDISVDVVAGGFVIAVAMISNAGAATWSCPGLTIDSSDSIVNAQSFGASVSKAIAASPRSITAQFTNSGGGPFGPTVVAASFK